MADRKDGVTMSPIWNPLDVELVECVVCGAIVSELDAKKICDDWHCKECAELPSADPLSEKPKPEISSNEYERTRRGFRSK